MNSPDGVTQIVMTILKIGLILFAVIHFLVGVLLYRQNSKMRRIINTKSGGCITFFSFINIMILLLIIVLVVIIPL